MQLYVALNQFIHSFKIFLINSKTRKTSFIFKTAYSYRSFDCFFSRVLSTSFQRECISSLYNSKLIWRLIAIYCFKLFAYRYKFLSKADLSSFWRWFVSFCRRGFKLFRRARGSYWYTSIRKHVSVVGFPVWLLQV